MGQFEGTTFTHQANKRVLKTSMSYLGRSWSFPVWNFKGSLYFCILLNHHGWADLHWNLVVLNSCSRFLIFIYFDLRSRYSRGTPFSHRALLSYMWSPTLVISLSCFLQWGVRRTTSTRLVSLVVLNASSLLGKKALKFLLSPCSLAYVGRSPNCPHSTLCGSPSPS